MMDDGKMAGDVIPGGESGAATLSSWMIPRTQEIYQQSFLLLRQKVVVLHIHKLRHSLVAIPAHLPPTRTRLVRVARQTRDEVSSEETVGLVLRAVYSRIEPCLPAMTNRTARWFLIPQSSRAIGMSAMR